MKLHFGDVDQLNCSYHRHYVHLLDRNLLFLQLCCYDCHGNYLKINGIFLCDSYYSQPILNYTIKYEAYIGQLLHLEPKKQFG
jgi:hypothetical protein